jgi:hypothetical protein
LLSYSVIYTEGEVTQGLFIMATWLTSAFLLIGFVRRQLAVWCILVVGGFLLLWQASRVRTWAIVQEEVIGIVRHVESIKARTGEYPVNLDGYTFRNQSVRAHIYRLEREEAGGFRLIYFMSNPGISYWYSSETGFGYYPD